jgi:hypothetical protein
MKERFLIIGMFICVFVLAGMVIVPALRRHRDDDNTGSTVTPVQCSCACPKQDCQGGGIVADGYNVNIVVDGEKWTPPALLSSDEAGYVTLCRKEDPELIGHPDLNFTKTYKLWHECLDELTETRSGFDDETNQICWQQEVF